LLPPPPTYTLSLHDALPISSGPGFSRPGRLRAVSGDKLTPLQRRILRVLASLQPPWTLTGGGALAGIHLGHRETRDLDLFWRNRSEEHTSELQSRVDLVCRL